MFAGTPEENSNGNLGCDHRNGGYRRFLGENPTRAQGQSEHLRTELAVSCERPASSRTLEARG
jgi:hypothetical protein